MLIETRAISPIPDRAVQITPSRTKDRFARDRQNNRYRRIHRQKSSNAFGTIHSFEKEEPMYDGLCRTILFHLEHIGSYVDLYV
jgi:hypothetical protein